MITYGSLCSGIGSESIAWHPLGWEAKWFSEIDPLCSSLLKQTYGLLNYGDIKRISNPERVNLIVGGTPCQSFSINANRKGMDDPRGKLSLHFVRIVDEVKPDWVIWENVENALSIDNGKAFSCIGYSLAECGYGWAYRILDLRAFGIPQRRRRLFLVGYRGDCRPAFASLFESEANAENSPTIKEMEEEDMAGVKWYPDGWSGDETPKRERRGIPTLRASQGGEGTGWILGRNKLRKLTMNEYEKLQGFPPGYTDIRVGRKRLSDSQRRKMIGNSFSPIVLFWIGQRINFIESAIRYRQHRQQINKGS